VAYVELTTGDGESFFGVGRHPSIVTASLEAVVCAVNRASEVEWRGSQRSAARMPETGPGGEVG
jgi:hypothetical protein